MLVVLNQPYQDPYELRGEVRFISARPGADVVACANLGIESAHSAIVHVLAAGYEVAEGWTNAVLRHFEDHKVGAVAACVEPPGADTASAGVGYKAGGKRYLVRQTVSPAKIARTLVAPAMGAGFYRKAALQSVGGFARDVGPVFADVDTGMAMRAAGYRAVSEPTALIQAVESSPAIGKVRQSYYAERLFWRNAHTAGWVKSLILHVCTLTAEVVSNLLSIALVGMIAARLLAACQWRHYRRHRQNLAAITRATYILPAKSGKKQVRVDRSHAMSSAQEQPRRAKAG